MPDRNSLEKIFCKHFLNTPPRTVPKRTTKGHACFPAFHICELNQQKSFLSHDLALGPNSKLFYFSLIFLPYQRVKNNNEYLDLCF